LLYSFFNQNNCMYGAYTYQPINKGAAGLIKDHRTFGKGIKRE